MIKKISAKYDNVDDIKAVGGEITIDGEKYIVEELATYFDEYENIHYVDYNVKLAALYEDELANLRNL